jgi:hypothetical protein
LLADGRQELAHVRGQVPLEVAADRHQPRRRGWRTGDEPVPSAGRVPEAWRRTGWRSGIRIGFPRSSRSRRLASERSVRGDDLRALTKQVMADPQQCRLALEVALTVNTIGERKAGWRNDVANFARIDSLGLDRVHPPLVLCALEAPDVQEQARRWVSDHA